MNAVDSNILLYSVDTHEPAKLSQAQALIEQLSDEQTILPWQALCEAANGLRRWANKGRISPLAAEGYVVVYSNPRGSKGDGEKFCAAIRGNWWISVPAIPSGYPVPSHFS